MWKRPTLKQSMAIGATLAIAAAVTTPAVAKGGPKHAASAVSVVIKTPAAGSSTTASTLSVAGTAATTTTSTSVTSVTSVAVEVDAAGWKTATGTSSWSTSIDTSKLANGSHTLTARATDSTGAQSTTAETFTVSLPDTTAPTIALSAPAGGSTVKGAVSITGTSSDNVGVTAVAVQVDSGSWQNASGTSSWNLTWDSSSVSNGAHTLTARATDAAGNVTKATANISVNNAVVDTTAPKIAITAPAGGSSQSGSVNVSGTASDDSAVAAVDVKIDSGSWQSATGSASWNFTWDASTAASGSHTITARATDSSGNSSTASVSVTVPSSTGGSTGGTTTAPDTQGSWVSPEGVHINVNSAGSWTIAQVYKLLTANALDLDKIGPHLTVNVQDSYTTQTTASSCCSPSYASYKAAIWLQGVNSNFASNPDADLTHEYGLAWAWYWYYLGHNGNWGGYLPARWTTSDGSQTLATDPRVGSAQNWDIAEIIADDYRLLFGSAPAVSEWPTHVNTSIPDPRNVPGLATFLLNQFRSAG